MGGALWRRIYILRYIARPLPLLYARRASNYNNNNKILLEGAFLPELHYSTTILQKPSSQASNAVY